MSTLKVSEIQSNALNAPPLIEDSAGVQVGTFCRAFVDFNGEGTVAIRASFNVLGITDNGVGLYSVNFANALPDANYTIVSFCAALTNQARALSGNATFAKSTTQITGLSSRTAADNVLVDSPFNSLAIFR